MKKLVLLAVAAVAVLLPLGGCTSSSEIQAKLGETFDVPIHHDAIVPADNLRLTFQQVSMDSRCPRNVQCVTAGEAIYTVRFTRGGEAASVTFTELGGGGYATAAFLDYSVNASLLPYPEQPGGIPPEDYVVRLTITHPPVADALPEDDMAAIYAAVIRGVLNNSGSGSTNLSDVYLVYITNDATHITPAAPPDPHLLAPTLRDKITSQLTDLSAGPHWVPGIDSLSLEGSGMTPPGGGLVVTLGNIHPGDAGTCQVYGGLYVSNVNGSGRVYVVARVNGAWQITGTTGVVWMS